MDSEEGSKLITQMLREGPANNFNNTERMSNNLSLADSNGNKLDRVQINWATRNQFLRNL